MNVSLRDKVRNEVFYGKLPTVMDKIRERRLKLDDHCIRHSELEASDLVLWEPTGKGKQGEPETDIRRHDMLRSDTGLESAGKLRSFMQGKCRWNARGS
jgi:hypothetical protein